MVLSAFKKFYFFDFYFMCFYGYFGCTMSVHNKYAMPMEPEEGVRCRGTGITDSYEQPSRCQKSKLGPLEEYLVLLTTQLSLHPVPSAV